MTHAARGASEWLRISDEDRTELSPGRNVEDATDTLNDAHEEEADGDAHGPIAAAPRPDVDLPPSVH